MILSICASKPLIPSPCRTVDADIDKTYAGLLTDESRAAGTTPRRIYFPETTDEVSTAIAEIAARGEAVTVSGARTGIAGGAVAAAPNLLSLEHLRGAPSLSTDDTGGAEAHVLAGTTLDELKESIGATGKTALFYPVDPTETSASIGGTVATNASGARTLKYGPTRDWVRGITAVLADGSIIRLRRGEISLNEKAIRIEGTTNVSIPIAPVPMPSTKHTAGYHLSGNMDPIDLFIGGEGTLCIITEIDLALAPIPAARLSVVLFLQRDEPSGLVTDLLSLSPAAIEYMDTNSIHLLRAAKESRSDSGAVPEMPPGTEAVIYVEFEGDNDEDIEAAFGQLEPLLEKYSISEDLTWAGFDQSDMEAMKHFRHALPERINTIIGERKRSLPALTKIGTDMSVPIDALQPMLDEYRRVLNKSGIEYCIFGHIGNAHLHVNILPGNMDQVDRAYEFYLQFAAKAVSLGGSVAGEHGIGRLKKRFMGVQYDAKALSDLEAVKMALDPEGLLNPGVLLDRYPDSN